MPTQIAPPPLKQDALLQAIDLYLSGEVPEGRETALWRASLAVYLGRLPEASAALAEAPRSALAEVLAAEVELAEGSYEASRERLSRLSGLDVGLAARVAVDLARVAQQQTDWDEVARQAERAIDLACEAGDGALEGMGYRMRAIARSSSVDADEAVDADLRRAVELLVETEDLRFRAFAEVTLAQRLVVTDDADGACNLLDHAERTFLQLGLELDAQTAQHGRAWAEFVRGRYGEALERTRAVLEVDRAQGSARGESWALQAGAVAAALAGELDEAVRLAETLVELRSLAGSEADLLEARLLLLRARARRGEAEAVTSLDDLLPEVDELEQPLLSATARVLRADALLGLSLPRAFAARDDAEVGRTLRGPWLLAEFRHLDERWTDQPARREGSRLVLDLDGPLLCRDAVHLIVDYVYLDAANRRTRRKTEAARMLCLTRRNYYKVKDGVEARLGPNPPKARLARRSD